MKATSSKFRTIWRPEQGIVIEMLFFYHLQKSSLEKKNKIQIKMKTVSLPEAVIWASVSRYREVASICRCPHSVSPHTVAFVRD